MTSRAGTGRRRKRQGTPPVPPIAPPPRKRELPSPVAPYQDDSTAFARFLRQPITALFALLLVAFFLRALWLDQPKGILIGDETWYVSAARAILGLPQPPGSHYFGALAGRDPNLEHPPLGKLLIAASMRLAGDDAWGWRWPSVVAGMLSVAFLYRLARRIGLGAWPAVLAGVLLAFDPLAFLFGRIGMLDGPMLLAIVAGLAWFLEGRPALAGIAFAFGFLCKEAGLIGPMAAVAYAVLAARRQRKDGAPGTPDLATTLAMLAAFAGLGLLA